MILKSNQICAFSLIALAMTSSFAANAMYNRGGDRNSWSSLADEPANTSGRPPQPPVYRPRESQPLRELSSTESHMGGGAFASIAPVWRAEEEAERRQVEAERARRQQIREEFARRERESEEKRLASVAAKEAAEGLPRQMHQLGINSSYQWPPAAAAASTTSQPTPPLSQPVLIDPPMLQFPPAFVSHPDLQGPPPPPYPVHAHSAGVLDVPVMDTPQGTQYQPHPALYSRGPTMPTPPAYQSQPTAPAGYSYSTPLPANPYVPASAAPYGRPQPSMQGGAASHLGHGASSPYATTRPMGGEFILPGSQQFNMDVPVLSASNRFDIYPEFPRYATRATNTGILAIKKLGRSLEVLLGKNNDARGKWRIPLGMESAEKVEQRKGRTVTRLALDTLASETGNVVALPETEISAYQALKDVPRIVAGDTVVFVVDMTDKLRRKLDPSELVQKWRTVPLQDLLTAARDHTDKAGTKALSSTLIQFLHTNEAVAVLEAVLNNPRLTQRGAGRRL